MKSQELRLDNPFESGYIKNYILLYGSVVIIMILFFTASSIFNDITYFEKKFFNTEINTSKENTIIEETKKALKYKFKLLEKAY